MKLSVFIISKYFMLKEIFVWLFELAMSFVFQYFSSFVSHAIVVINWFLFLQLFQFLFHWIIFVSAVTLLNVRFVPHF